MSESERMNVLELVILNSLSAGKLKAAKEYLEVVEKRFGKGSSRVQVLQGMYAETEGRLVDAKAIYQQILKSNPGHGVAAMRLSAMAKSQGYLVEAIRSLEGDLIFVDEDNERHTYLELYPNEANALRELSKLYYELNNLDKAIYYAESEALMNNDFYVLHNRLGELYYQKKDYSKSVCAYSYSLLMNPTNNNVRAAYGLRLAAGKVLAAHRSGAKKIADETDVKTLEGLYSKVVEKLTAMYAHSPLLPHVSHYLGIKE